MRQFDVIFSSAHGRYELEFSHTQTIEEICTLHRIPAQQVSTYLESDTTCDLFVNFHSPVKEIHDGRNIIIVPNRNIDYRKIIALPRKVLFKENASAWIRHAEHDQSGNPREIVSEYLSPSDCRSLVNKHVAEAVAKYLKNDTKVVVGVSGGGDSNALLGALVNSGILSKENIFPTMMLGIPDWDRGLERAQEICDEYSLPLSVVKPEETARILGFDEKTDWVTEFEKTFAGDDLEVLGVFGVRKVLAAKASEIQSQTIVIGSNLEDCLSDVLYFIASGISPFPKPLGSYEGCQLFYPLWQIPKMVLDGCYPKLSRANYEARFPSVMFGRALFYYLAQVIVEAFPGAAQDLLRGSSKLGDEFFLKATQDGDLGLETIAPIPLKLRRELHRLWNSSRIA